MMTQSMQPSSTLRRAALEFLIDSAGELGVPPMVKYSALSLFADRFFPSLSSISHSQSQIWLLYPIRTSNLQLFALISLWISTKFHASSPRLPLKTLKSIADNQISDEHFTKSDFVEAEIIFLQTLHFEIGILSCSAFAITEEMVYKLRAVAKVGEMVSFETCLDVLDLVYENEGISRLFVESAVCICAGIVVASFVISVPKQRWEFPLLSWMNFVTGCKEGEIMDIVKAILDHILLPSAQCK